MKQLGGLDASFVHLEGSRTHFQMGTLLLYDVSTARNNFVCFKDILSIFKSRVGQQSVLRKKLHQVPFSLDHPYWVDDPGFNIEYHVRHIALPKPGDWRQLCILVARIHARPLNLGVPLWEVHVIEGLDNVEGVPTGSFALYVKLHHASLDGVAGNELVSAIHDLGPFPEHRSHLTDERIPDPAPGNMEMLARAYKNLLLQPQRVFGLGRRAVPAWLRILAGRRDKAFTPLGPSQQTRFNGRVSGHLVIDAVILKLDDMKRIKNAFEGVTINDVMLATVSGSMHKYLAAKGETPVQDLSAAMPINIRPMLEKQDYSNTGNLVSLAKVSLNNTLENPAKRLQAIHQSARESRAYQDALGADMMLELSQSMPALLTSLAARAVPTLLTRGYPIVNTVISNVPGSQVPLYMGGARLAGMCNIGIVLDGMGLFHAVSSYCGTATISFQACREAMPDPEFYRQCVQESFSELRQAAMRSGRRKNTSASRNRSPGKRKRASQ